MVVTPIDQFNTAVVAADALVQMYVELRRTRGLGARGPLDAENIDLLWLPRSAVVATLSALDAYVHHVLHEQLPVVVKGLAPPPETLLSRLAETLPIKSAGTFRDALPFLAANDTLDQLIQRLEEKTLRFQTYQSPEKIEEAYELIGKDQIFAQVAAIWPGPPQDIKRRLSTYCRRRNQIAHEGDLEPNGVSRPMQPRYAEECREFVGGLVSRLNRVVYGL